MGVPRFESQSTGPQTNNYPLVDRNHKNISFPKYLGDELEEHLLLAGINYYCFRFVGIFFGPGHWQTSTFLLKHITLEAKVIFFYMDHPIWELTHLLAIDPNFLGHPSTTKILETPYIVPLGSFIHWIYPPRTYDAIVASEGILLSAVGLVGYFHLRLWMFPKIGVGPPNHPFLIGFSIVFTIHFGGKIPQG